MNRPLLAMFACYALGLVAGRQEYHCVEAQRSASTEPAVQQESVRAPVVQPVIKTPSVEKLLPKSEPPKPAIADGQLSPGKQWRWSEAQWAWVPVKQAGPMWVQDGHSATIDHLVREHGYRRADLVRLTQQQLDVLHSNAHNSARARRASAPVVRSGGCPGGRCPSTSYRGWR